AAAVPARAGEVSPRTAARQEQLEQLEEADFYMQQGLHDEAEAIYRRVLEAAPNHPRALLRLGEISAARGSAPASSPARRADTDETPVPEIDFDAEGELTEPEREEPQPDEVEISVEFSDDEAEIGAPEPAATDADLDDLASLDLDGPASDEVEQSAEDGSDTEELLRPVGEARPASAVAASTASAAQGGSALAAALSDAFDDDTGPGPRTALPAGDDGFAAVFQAFKKGVRETLSEGDHQAHYDLAIAYKEMGLYDDAIYELRTAMADPNRTAECLHLIGLCATDSDQAPLAIEHLEQLLLLPRLARDAALAGRFDLGRALEAVGDIEGARREWQAVAAQKPDFQNVRARLAGLGAPKTDAAAA